MLLILLACEGGETGDSGDEPEACDNDLDDDECLGDEACPTRDFELSLEATWGEMAVGWGPYFEGVFAYGPRLPARHLRVPATAGTPGLDEPVRGRGPLTPASPLVRGRPCC